MTEAAYLRRETTGAIHVDVWHEHGRVFSAGAPDAVVGANDLTLTQAWANETLRANEYEPVSNWSQPDGWDTDHFDLRAEVVETKGLPMPPEMAERARLVQPGAGVPDSMQRLQARAARPALRVTQ